MAKKAPSKQTKKKVEPENTTAKPKTNKTTKASENKKENATPTTKEVPTKKIDTPSVSKTVDVKKTKETPADEKDKTTSTSKSRGWGAGVSDLEEPVTEKQVEKEVVKQDVKSETKAVKETKTLKVIDLTDKEVTHVPQEKRTNLPAELQNLQIHLPRVLAGHTGFGDITEQIVRETIEREGWYDKEYYAISFEPSIEEPRTMKAVIVRETFAGDKGASVRIPESGYLKIV